MRHQHNNYIVHSNSVNKVIIGSNSVNKVIIGETHNTLFTVKQGDNW